MIKRVLFFVLISKASAAFAIWPLVFGLTGVEQVALGASVVLHTAVAAIAFKNSPSDSAPALVVNLSPNAQVSSGVPAGWAAGTKQGDYPVPPILASASSLYVTSPGGYSGVSKETAASSAVKNCGDPTCFIKDWPTTNSFRLFAKTATFATTTIDYLVGTYTVSQSFSCPAGYSVSGSQCNLSTPSAVPLPNDGTKYVPRSGNIFAPSTRDSDPTPAGVVYPSSNSISYTKSETGEKVTITLQSTGEGVISYSHPTTSGLDTVVENYGITAPDSSGNVVVSGVSSQTYSGTGSQTSTTPSTSSSVQFPSDYARTGEAAAAAATLKPGIDSIGNKLTETNTKLDKLHDDLTKPGDSPADPTAPDVSEFKNAFFNGTFSDLIAWRLPSHTSTCPVAVFDYSLFGSHHHLVMDAQCTIAESVRETLSLVMVALFTVVALFIVLGA